MSESDYGFARSNNRNADEGGNQSSVILLSESCSSFSNKFDEKSSKIKITNIENSDNSE